MGRKKKIDTLKITANGSHSEEVKNGNEVANTSSNLTEQIEQLFKTDRKKFLGFIRQRVRSQEEAEDILQDVFTNVLAASANVQKPIENIASWVFTAVRNRIIDSYRKKRAETFTDMQTQGQADEGVDSFENFLGDLSTSPESDLIRKTIWEAVLEGLNELPDEQKDVFVKNEFEGISFREMSEETGVNINTLLARKRYAVLHLRKKLRDLYKSVNNS
ncbi:MAG TPA: sigma-70 family RNA polymerase sigma factor [Candidatus Kapabacteria bacterium]|nr:sigma-70 family RNA polymerase sigma factor [Candidatus Kapabacteria bacterium]HOQ49918.1 sigma-70 family RNA polymerase sigma factor [Candidatus Kapabacteria bacterium]HPP39185.1 sigma-70 family RNA polymerase sigma factor [Candidatus Kapabacteria bacterium]HPU22657.1 sigma-70 family RNA polymerase sigma factor [Candidatus Kapabacteria bacterium]